MATYLAAIVCCALLVRLVFYIVQKATRRRVNQNREKRTWLRYLASFTSGALLINALPHLVHGISGEYFPAPFGKYLGRGFLEYLANVLWGLLNLYVGYRLFAYGEIRREDRFGKLCFGIGAVLMSVFLCFVFSRLHQ